MAGAAYLTLLERSRNKEISKEPRVGLEFGDWLTRYTGFLVKWNIYSNMKVLLLT